MAILSKKGVTPNMEFKCSDCGDTTTGKDVLEGAYLHIVEINPVNRMESLFRCECCHEDRYEDCNCE